jgi:hypothetical protein
MADAPEGGLQVTLDLPFHKGAAPLAQPEVALG